MVLKDKNVKANILKQARLLQISKDHSNIYIGSDLTKMQRVEMSDLRKELFERRNNGEKFFLSGQAELSKGRRKPPASN